MAVSDRWYRTEKQPDGSKKRVKSREHGRGDRWLVRWRDEHGKQRAKAFAKCSDADRFDAKVRDQLNEGSYIDPREGKVSFKAYAEQWRTNAMHRPGTAEKVERELRNHVYPMLGSRAMASFRSSHVQAWVTDRSKALAPSTLAVVYGYVASIFKAAVRNRVIGRTPCVDIRLPEGPRKKVEPVPAETIAALAMHVPAQYEAVVWLVAGSGIRQAEVFGLEVECVDFLRRELHVRQQLATDQEYRPYLAPPKSPESYRTIPLDDETVRILSAHLAAYPAVEVEIDDRTDPHRPKRRTARMLFTTSAGKPVQRASWASIFSPHARAVGMPPGKGLHEIRHFYASMLIRYGASVKEVQARMGHSSGKITLDTYGHLWPDGDERTRGAVTAGLAHVHPMCTGQATKDASAQVKGGAE